MEDKEIIQGAHLGCNISCSHSDGFKYTTFPTESIYCTFLKKYITEGYPCLKFNEDNPLLEESICINLPRGCGKTVLLIRLSAKTGYPIVVSSTVEVERIKEIAKTLKLIIPSPVFYKDACAHFIGNSNYTGQILLDNKELFPDAALQKIQEKYPIYVYTTSRGEMIELSEVLIQPDLYK